MLKRFRIALAGGLIQSRIHMPQIVWRDLVDIVVQPVGKQQVSVTSPAGPRCVLWVIMREIIGRYFRAEPRFHIAEKLPRQGIGIVFRMSGDEGNALIFAGKQIGIALFGFCQDL